MSDPETELQGFIDRFTPEIAARARARAGRKWPMAGQGGYIRSVWPKQRPRRPREEP